MHRYFSPTAKTAGPLLPLTLRIKESGVGEATPKLWLTVAIIAVFAAWIPLMLLVSSLWLGWPSWMADWLITNSG